MLYEYMLELGYTKEEIDLIINDYSLKRYKKETLYHKIKEIVSFFERLC